MKTLLIFLALVCSSVTAEEYKYGVLCSYDQDGNFFVSEYRYMLNSKGYAYKFYLEGKHLYYCKRYYEKIPVSDLSKKAKELLDDKRYSYKDTAAFRESVNYESRKAVTKALYQEDTAKYCAERGVDSIGDKNLGKDPTTCLKKFLGL